MKRGENEATPRRVTGGCFDKCAFRDQGETLLFVQVDGVLLVVRAAELNLISTSRYSLVLSSWTLPSASFSRVNRVT